MGRKLIDLIGQRFGRLIVVRYIGREHHSSCWACVCDCGKEIQVQSVALKSKNIFSCGCYRRERMAALTFKHGERCRSIYSPEYKAWDSMKDRCYNQKNKNWHLYGGRGISVCDKWLNDFSEFLKDMGRRPTGMQSIDRIDNNGNYEPLNCRWATALQQSRNRSNNRIVEYQGQLVPLSLAADLAGIPYITVKSRLGKGWDIKDALSRPIDKRKQIAGRYPRKIGRT